ncbi:hypothetical protein EV179_006380 [Coemansia sp. RSA 487]|nr:hypothetical protein EV179_006380 [Coemansia sp. RSA 487]
MAVSVTRDPYKTPHRTDGVGSRPIKPDNNILQNYEARTIKNKDIKQLDKETSDENMKKWRNEEMYIPFVDPSTDSLQDNVREVCVKITGVGKDTEGDVDDTNNWLLDKMSSLETRYGVRPQGPAHLLSLMRAFDAARLIMIAFIRKVAPEEVDSIPRIDDVIRDITRKRRIHYYSFKPSVDLRKLIFEQDIDAVFGGSDGVPEDYQVILSTKRFRITALDISGGTSSHISDFYECIEPLSTDDNCLIECFKYLSGSNEDCQEIRRKLSIKSEGLLGNKNIPKLEEYFNLEVCVRLDEFNVENEDGANFFTPRIIYGDEDCESWLLLKDSHYSIILEEKIYDIVKTAKTKEPDVEKNRHSKTLYYFFDYETVWDPLQDYINDNYSKIREYNIMDVKTLSELYFKTRHELKRLCEVNIEEHMTLAVNEKKKQDVLKERGSDDYNPAVRELCKLLMNSLSGKLIQKDYDDVIEIISSKEQMNKFRQKCKQDINIIDINKDVCIVSGTLQQYINKMPTIYGALIYSYARSHMYDTILSKVDPSKLFGMDTDSAFITVGQYHELLAKYPEIFGDDFGQFKEEVLELVDNNKEDGPFGIFVAPKCYCFYARDKKTGQERFVKARFKGINIDRDRIWDNTVDYKKLDAREVHDHYYGDTLARVDVAFYRTCLKQDVTILHSNLAKTVMNKTEYLNIKQHFCLKVIKHNA